MAKQNFAFSCESNVESKGWKKDEKIWKGIWCEFDDSKMLERPNKNQSKLIDSGVHELCDIMCGKMFHKVKSTKVN